MKLKDIIEFLGLECDEKYYDLEISGLNSLQNANFMELSYCDGEKSVSSMQITGAGAVLTNAEYASNVPKDTVALISPNPKLSFALLSKIFAKKLIRTKKENQIDKSVTIMPNVYIGSGVSIGKGSIIMAGAYIGDDVSIGEECIIHPNVVLYNDTKIGNKCHLLANCVIGSDGFGYASTKSGEHHKIYHNGNVVIEDFVEIGACTTIDRAVFDSTIIKQGSKIDNLVQIGHNCIIGQNCIVVSQTGLSGSSELGKNVIMGGQSATSGHLKIGDFTTIAARGGVTKNLEGGRVYGGFPILLQQDWLKMQAKISKTFKD